MNKFLFLLLVPKIYSSQVNKIKIEKYDYSIYFFQISESDTISAKKNDLFIIKLGNKRNCTTNIDITNGCLSSTGKDSIFRIKHTPGVNYSHFFQEPTSPTATPQRKTNCSQFAYYINGASNNSSTKEIIIRFRNINNDSLLLTNKYYYR